MEKILSLVSGRNELGIIILGPDNRECQGYRSWKVANPQPDLEVEHARNTRGFVPTFVRASFDRVEGRKGYYKTYYDCKVVPDDRMVVHVSKCFVGLCARYWRKGSVSDWTYNYRFRALFCNLIEAESQDHDYYGLVREGKEADVAEILFRLAAINNKEEADVTASLSRIASLNKE